MLGSKQTNYLGGSESSSYVGTIRVPAGFPSKCEPTHDMTYHIIQPSITPPPAKHEKSKKNKKHTQLASPLPQPPPPRARPTSRSSRSAGVSRSRGRVCLGAGSSETDSGLVAPWDKIRWTTTEGNHGWYFFRYSAFGFPPSCGGCLGLLAIVLCLSGKAATCFVFCVYGPGLRAHGLTKTTRKAATWIGGLGKLFQTASFEESRFDP